MNVIERNVRLNRAFWQDRRVPWVARVIFILALSYCVWPFDLIPDSTPYIGFADDVCISLIGFFVARLLIPFEVIYACRHGKAPPRNTFARELAESNDKIFNVLMILLLIVILGLSIEAYRMGWPAALQHMRAMFYVLTFD